jgi:mannobiose 2-epimerase
LIEEHSLDRENGGYIEALTRDWLPLANMRLSAKDANEPKSMNTHLHIIEPYTTLYEVWPDAGLSIQMKKLIRIFLDKIVNPANNHLHLFMKKDWTVKSNIVSYGHDIEATWLLCEAAKILGDDCLLKEAQAASIRISDATIKDGMAPDGSLYYEKDMSSNIIVEDRHWWVQVEAMVGFMNTWQITGNPLYLKKVETLWNYTTQNIIDHQEGGWFNRIDKDGNPILDDPKIGFWKCPYHNTRALMEIMRRLEVKTVEVLPSENTFQ